MWRPRYFISQSLYQNLKEIGRMVLYETRVNSMLRNFTRLYDYMRTI